MMTAGREKLQAETRYNFSLEDGESKIIPWYWQSKDTDGENNSNFDLTNYPASEILWKSVCAGGYYCMDVFNEDSKGAVLGLTFLNLNKYNEDTFDTAVDIGTKINNTKSSVLSEIVQDTLKDDDISRQFVPHIKRVTLEPREADRKEGVLATGKEISPITTPFMRCLMISNLTPISSSKVTFQIEQNFYQYANGISEPTRSTVLTDEEA